MKFEMVIAITGLNANDNPGPGVAVARALRNAFGSSLKIVGLCYEALEPGIYMPDLIDIAYLIPYPGAGISDLKERLNQIQQKENIDVMIPNFDSELYNFIKISDWLARLGIRTFLPSAEQLAMREKADLAAFAEKHGFFAPADEKLHSAAAINKAAALFGFPMVIKGKFYEAEICHSMDIAQKAFHRLAARWGLPVIAQQYIKGSEINVAGLGDGRGGIVSVVPMRKLYITDKGKGWAGVTIEGADLIDLARQFTAATRWRGSFELEVMRDAGGKLYILEINPRFPAWVYLTAGAGQNQPEALVKMALGEEVYPFTSYQTGKMFVRYSWDELIDLSDFQQISAFGELNMHNITV